MGRVYMTGADTFAVIYFRDTDPARRANAAREFSVRLTPLAGGPTPVILAAAFYGDGQYRLGITRRPGRFPEKVLSALLTPPSGEGCLTAFGVGYFNNPGISLRELKEGTATSHCVSIAAGAVSNCGVVNEHFGYGHRAAPCSCIAVLTDLAVTSARENDMLKNVAAYYRLLDGDFAAVAWDRRKPGDIFAASYKRPLLFGVDVYPGALLIGAGDFLISSDLFNVPAPDNNLWVFSPHTEVTTARRIFPERRADLSPCNRPPRHLTAARGLLT